MCVAALRNTVKTTVLRTDIELVLRGHKGRKYCRSAKTDTEGCVFVEQVMTIFHQTCTYLRLGLLLSYNTGSTCLASFFLSCRPTETQCAVLSVTYIVVLSAWKWLPWISGYPDETVYHISLLFRCILRQGQCDLLFMFAWPSYTSLPTD